jgi:hypothetical protein
VYFGIAGWVRSPKIPVTAACGRLFHWGRHEAQGQGQGRRQEVLTVIAQDADDVLYLSADEPDPSAGWVRESATRWRRDLPERESTQGFSNVHEWSPTGQQQSE